MSTALWVGIITVFSTLLGGLFALRFKDKLHLILGFSAGAVIGVAFFDLLPESLSLATPFYPVSQVASVIAGGFLLFMFLSRVFLLHPHAADENHHNETAIGQMEAGSLSIHSFIDGLGIGLSFQVSPEVGFIVAAAVLAHDFSDGINTVGFILNHKGNIYDALYWLVVDAVAPLLGVVASRFFSLTSTELGLVLALFCGFFIYIGASDLLPESQHQHPKLETSAMTIIGALVIHAAIRLAGM